MNLLVALALCGALWQTDSLGEFRKGTFFNVSLTSTPELRLGPELIDRVETKPSLIHCLAVGRSDEVYAGTGTDGSVYCLREGKAEALFTVLNAQVLSLALDRHGGIFAGTGPDGLIYHIAGDRNEVYFATGQKYVWALVTDDAGNLYAGTGDSGLVYKITGKDKGSILYDAPQAHIMCLEWHGALYAGSSGKGIVYRLETGGNRPLATVLYATPRAEVRALAVASSGVVYAAANPEPDRSSVDNSPQVYEIRPDGNATLLFAPDDSLIFALALTTRRLLVGTGSKARLYSINLDSSPGCATSVLLLEAREAQLSALAVGGQTGRGGEPLIVYATSNPGRIGRLGPSYTREGQFVSRVFDSGAISRWGRCFWTGTTPLGTGLTVATRTGNSAEPDNTWSDWQALQGDQVTSQPARYLQYRVSLATADDRATPTLSRLTIAYVQTNLPPVIRSIRIRPDENGRLREQTVTWEASDPNSDSLSVSILVRSSGEQQWQALVQDKPGLSRFTIETDRLPDGWYDTKLVVSDRPSNPLGSQLTTERLGPRLLVDNTPPRVDELAVTRLGSGNYRLSFTVRDELSLIARCEVSSNYRDWQPVMPESGIFDHETERFAVELELKPGENVVAIRAQDQAGNTGTGRKLVSTH